MSASKTRARDLRIAIIGAGPGGLCMAIRLKQAGFEDFVLLEKSEGVGGTWNHNRYPGCECDIPSHLYSFSFEIKPDWSKPYGTQPEILEYFEAIAAKYGLLPHCRFGTEVKGAHWDERSARWKVELASGEQVEADVVVSALGMFNELSRPAIDGLDDFEGTLFHSARWDWDHDLSGETVGVIGSAASAVQFVPEIVKTAGQVHLFQRTANWVQPKEDDPFTEEELEHFRADSSLPLAVRQEIFDRVDGDLVFSNTELVASMEARVLEAIEVVEDPKVRVKLRPDHPVGCKRPLFSNYYYPAFNRPNLELVTEGIERVTADSVVTVDGKSRRVDTLILATGFQTTRYLSALDVRGRGGRHIDDAWSDGAQAYLGITTSGFPNLFMLYGPNTNNGSILTMIEAQVDYSLRKIEQIAEENLAWLDVKPEPQAAYNEKVQKAIAAVPVWNHEVNGYYRSPSGRVVTQWPFSMSEFQRQTSVPDADAYETASR
ncbi:MAG: NAD(P)/FAD-dependent oxidoreductase [Deltaproteobacteria bacterium]|jgi:cation diffusion facilitator CzcD-associated flavoprotein CzcO|nr:NAD(P)/FAD-dependent oxidoreductase [Deltaproteobacteria bacterium]MBW2501018.1 NAD(P)/FAD-dependent oxidoreductase [Deltaproteobacteria bacterium]